MTHFFILMGGAGGGDVNPLVQLLPIALIFIVFYFFMIRPQKKKEDERKKLLDTLKKGDKIVTIGGLHGVVAGVDAEKKTVLVQAADNVKFTFDRTAISVIAKQDAGDKLEA
jgi:preprotein translocase subunit YajC